MRVAICQVEVRDDEPVAARVKRVADIVRTQQADLVVLPELWAPGAFSYDAWVDVAEPIDGPTVTALRAAAREVGAIVHAGSFVERADDGRLHNTAVLVGGDGEVLASYRKLHLFGFGEGEPALMSGGREVVVHDGIGLATCYDLRFPELFRALLDAGAETFVVVAGWPSARAGHWRLLAQARAVENQAYVIACNTAGTHAGKEMAGGSLVVDPWGEVVAEAARDEQVLIAEIDPGLVRRTRERFPVLRDRVL